MKIAHVSVLGTPILYPYGGAIQRRIFEIAKEQAKRGDHVSVYSIGDQREIKEVSGVKINYLCCKSSLPWRHLEFQLRAVAGIKKQEKAFDVIHFHSQPEGAILSSFIRSKKFLSYDYFYFRGGRRTPLYYLYHCFLNQFDLLFPVSEYCLQESQQYWRIHKEKFQVVYNGVNLDQFHPDTGIQDIERERLGIEKRVVLYVGRLCYQKGTDVLIDAIQILNEKRNDIQLVIAGPVAQFGAHSDPEGWSRRIKGVGGLYLGPVEESRLNAIYNLADIFVMPTRELEMFGMAVIEAQACRKAVVASDHGGLRETVPETCGARFPVGEPEKLAEKIEMLLDDSDRYDRCCTNALQNATQYDWSRICARLDELYCLKV
jgi:glycosyltransferase involved in cell wall biosynthesis